MWYSAVGCIVTLILSLLVAPLAAVAQQAKHVPRIGILAPTLDPHDPGSSFQAFRQGLRDLGYVEGQSIALEYRVAEGGSVSKVEMVTPMALIYKALFPSISTFETPPKERYGLTTFHKVDTHG